jgi:hypothetical protein
LPLAQTTAPQKSGRSPLRALSSTLKVMQRRFIPCVGLLLAPALSIPPRIFDWPLHLLTMPLKCGIRSTAMSWCQFRYTSSQCTLLPFRRAVTTSHRDHLTARLPSRMLRVRSFSSKPLTQSSFVSFSARSGTGAPTASLRWLGMPKETKLQLAVRTSKALLLDVAILLQHCAGMFEFLI